MAFKKALIERALSGELSHHLGDPPDGDKPAAAGNHRNGNTGKTERTEDGRLRSSPGARGIFRAPSEPKHERRSIGEGWTAAGSAMNWGADAGARAPAWLA